MIERPGSSTRAAAREESAVRPGPGPVAISTPPPPRRRGRGRSKATRGALAAELRDQEVPHLPGPQLVDRGIIRRALRAAVPRPVVVAAVAPQVAVGLVVLAVVADQVPQREAVVAGDEVHRRDRPPRAGLVQVAGPGQPGRELGQRGGPAAPEVADRVAVLAVPLRPQRRELADLVAALAHVPGLGDQLDLGYHPCLLDPGAETPRPDHVVARPDEGRGQVVT